MDKSITLDNVRSNMKIVSNDMRKIMLEGTFQKFTDEEKDNFNRMKILLDNTIYSEWEKDNLICCMGRYYDRPI